MENIKKRLKEDCILAWETLSSLEEVETKVSLNLEFKKDVLAIEERCLAIEKMDTGVSFKVEPTKGPDKYKPNLLLLLLLFRVKDENNDEVKFSE